MRASWSHRSPTPPSHYPVLLAGSSYSSLTPANVLGRQQMVQGLGGLLQTEQAPVEFLVPGLGLSQPWLLVVFGE